MRPSGVVMDAPALDDHLRLPEAVEDFAIEASSLSLPLKDSQKPFDLQSPHRGDC
jgi:hypothetical protein